MFYTCCCNRESLGRLIYKRLTHFSDIPQELFDKLSCQEAGRCFQVLAYFTTGVFLHLLLGF